MAQEVVLKIKVLDTECFRLMGFLNDEINLEGLSNTQQYKLAGNGWDINLVSKILRKIFIVEQVYISIMTESGEIEEVEE